MATKASPKKTTGTRKTAPSKGTKAATNKPAERKKEITEEAIEAKAHEIYLERMAKGELGDHESDWHKAVELLKKGK